MSKFYSFRQNNTGGSFEIDTDSGITVYVIIEAGSADEANRIAESKGIYFNGCDTGSDCECCGDRWYKVGEYDSKEFPHSYGARLGVGGLNGAYQWAPDGKEHCVHYLDGRMEWFASDGSPSA